MAIKAKRPAELPPARSRRSIRKRAGISSTELAAYVGVSTASLHYWETGEREPSGSNRDAYAKALSELAAQVGYETADA